MTRRRASLVAFLAGPRTSGSAAYSSNRSCMASKTLRDSSPWVRPVAPFSCVALCSAERSRATWAKSLKWPACSEASWRLSVKLRSLRASGLRSRSPCSSMSDRTARIVVAVLRLSTPSVASLARSDRWLLV